MEEEDDFTIECTQEEVEALTEKLLDNDEIIIQEPQVMNNGVFEDPGHNEGSCYVFPDTVNMPLKPQIVRFIFSETEQHLNNPLLDQISMSNEYGSFSSSSAQSPDSNVDILAQNDSFVIHEERSSMPDSQDIQ